MVIKRRNSINLKDVGIPNVVPSAQPNPQGSVLSKLPSERAAVKPPEGNGSPKYVLRSVHNPSVNSAEGNSISNINVNNAVKKSNSQSKCKYWCSKQLYLKWCQ